MKSSKSDVVKSNWKQWTQNDEEAACRKHGITTHTPGPWQIHDNIGRKSEMGIVANGAPCIVAIMGNAKAWPIEAHANAQLIAAAPDLLEACKVVLAHCEDPNAPRINNQCTLCFSHRALLRDAITKATQKEGAK